MRSTMSMIHLGKAGLTASFIEGLEKTFKNHDLVKIIVLKSACRDRIAIKNLANEICSSLKGKQGKDFTAKIVGFTIYVKKWRKPRQ